MKTNAIYIADTSAMVYRPGPLARTWKRQFRAALRALSPPKTPWWYRAVFTWVATPLGLFTNFFCWFVGIHWWGAAFFVGWLFVALFLPSAIIYHRTAQEALQAEQARRSKRY